MRRICVDTSAVAHLQCVDNTVDQVGARASAETMQGGPIDDGDQDSHSVVSSLFADEEVELDAHPQAKKDEREDNSCPQACF